MAPSTQAPHWLFQTVRDFIQQLRQHAASSNPTSLTGSIRVVFDIHLWQKGTQDHGMYLFTNHHGRFDIPREHLRSIQDAGHTDWKIHEVVRHMLAEPLANGQIRELQFLDINSPECLINSDTTPVGHRELHVPIMLSAEIDLGGEAMTVQHLAGLSDVLQDPQPLTLAEIEQYQQIPSPFLEGWNLQAIFERRETLIKARTLERHGTDSHAVRRLLESTVELLLDVKSMAPEAPLSGSGCGLAIVQQDQEARQDGVMFLLGSGVSEPQLGDIDHGVTHEGVRYAILMSFGWDEEGWEPRALGDAIDCVELDVWLEDDGRVRAAGWESFEMVETDEVHDAGSGRGELRTHRLSPGEELAAGRLLVAVENAGDQSSSSSD